MNKDLKSHKHQDCDCEERNEIYDADGVDNKEHILDMIERSNLHFENIKDNTDTAINLLKNYENEDDDFIDAIKIKCNDIVDVEKRASEIIDKINIMENSFKSKVEEIPIGEINILEEYLEVIKNCENVSNRLLENLLKRLI